jgi:hypothetical protein
MAKRGMKKKALNLAEHKARLESSGQGPASGMGWAVALLALLTALLLLTLLR